MRIKKNICSFLFSKWPPVWPPLPNGKLNVGLSAPTLALHFTTERIIFTILFMLTISVKLTLFVFIFIPVSGFLISLIGKSLKRKSDKVQKEQGHFLSLLEESLGGLKVIKGFTAENIFLGKFHESTNRFFHFSNSLLNRTNLAKPTSEFLGIAVIGVLLWFGGTMVLSEGTLDK